jgi:hypothetical protein
VRAIHVARVGEGFRYLSSEGAPLDDAQVLAALEGALRVRTYYGLVISGAVLLGGLNAMDQGYRFLAVLLLPLAPLVYVVLNALAQRGAVHLVYDLDDPQVARLAEEARTLAERLDATRLPRVHGANGPWSFEDRVLFPERLLRVDGGRLAPCGEDEWEQLRSRAGPNTS